MTYVLSPPNNLPTIDHDPDASLVYGVDVAAVLADGDAVATASATGSGVTAGAAAIDGTVLSARVSGGTVGSTASVLFRWTTTGGDTDDRTIYLRVVHR